jgi:nucleoid DNA-binding protein
MQGKKDRKALILAVQKQLRERAGFRASYGDASMIYEAVCSAIYDRLHAGDDVWITKVGHTKHKNVCPRDFDFTRGLTKVRGHTPAHQILGFKFSPELQSLVSRDTMQGEVTRYYVDEDGNMIYEGFDEDEDEGMDEEDEEDDDLDPED